MYLHSGDRGSVPPFCSRLISPRHRQLRLHEPYFSTLISLPSSSFPFISLIASSAALPPSNSMKAKECFISIDLTSPNFSNAFFRSFSSTFLASFPTKIFESDIAHEIFPMYSALIPVSYTHLTLPTIYSV
eukprot:TRINITY_DN2187_c0_g1_i1.p1 TRINITY_DN2187_c0_g1~~TRINITY_DN2187_c0_g1_i1.p1  ORF type:complete len:131 (+),score=2.65 TRINITY_DN2187_c0_g1_i1:642-1034(+)